MSHDQRVAITWKSVAIGLITALIGTATWAYQDVRTDIKTIQQTHVSREDFIRVEDKIDALYLYMWQTHSHPKNEARPPELTPMERISPDLKSGGK